MSGLSTLSSITIALTSISDIPTTISDTPILSFNVPTLTSSISTSSSVLVPPPTFIPVHGFQSALSGLTVDPSTIPVTSTHTVQVTPSQSTFLSSTGPSPASGTPTAVLASDNASTASSSLSSSTSVGSPTLTLTTESSSPSLLAASGTKTSSSSSSTSVGSPTLTLTTESSSPSLLAASGTKTSPSSTSAPPSSSTSITAMSTSHSKNVIIGGVVGGVVGPLVITAILMYYLIRRSRRGRKFHDPAHVTTSEVSPDKSIEPMPQPKLQVGPHPPAPTPEISTTSSPSVSGSNITYFIPIDAHHKIEETADQSSLDTTIPQRDSLIDQSIPDSNLSSTELTQTTPPVTHKTSNPNPLLWDIVNAASQGCHQGFSDPGDANISQKFRTTTIHQPSDTDGSVLNDNSNREDRGVHYSRSSSRNSDTDTLSLSTEW